MTFLTKLGWAVLNAIQAVVLCVWTAFWITLALLLMVVTLRRDVPLAVARHCWGPGLLWFAGARLVVEGREGVDFARPHVFVMNHQSLIDVVAAFVAIPANIRFVAKKSLAYVPFLGWYMAATGMAFVDRRNGARAIASLRRVGRRIREGWNILAFPEGTRTRDGTVGAFKKGAFMVALEAGVPVVPIAIEGGFRVLARGGFRVRPGTIRLRFGAPIPTAGLSPVQRDELVTRAREALIDLHLAIGGEGGERAAAVAGRGHAPIAPTRRDEALSA